MISISTTTYETVEEAYADLQAVPSYIERPMSQEEEEDLCYQIRETDERIQVQTEVDACWNSRKVA